MLIVMTVVKYTMRSSEFTQPRLNIKEQLAGSTRLFLTATLKPEFMSWLDKAADPTGSKVVAEMTIDLDPERLRAHLNQVNAWVSRKGYGRELVAYGLGWLKRNGYFDATAYTERANFTSQDMLRKLGATETSRTEQGVNWIIKLKHGIG